MNFNIIIFLLFTTLVSTNNNLPKVYEEINEQLVTDSSDNIRKLRESAGYSPLKIFYEPPKFNFGLARQQDQRKFRYAQQQFVDLTNLLLKKPLMKYNSLSNLNKDQTIESRQVPVKVSLVQDWKAVNPELLQNQKLLSSYKLIKLNESKSHQIPKISVRLGRKLNPDTNYHGTELIDKSTISRQDHIPANGQIIYVDSNFLHKHFGLDPNVAQNIIANSVPNPISKSQHDLNALNELIGKNPNVQLEGLKKLLENGVIQSKDHTPIIEQTIDIPNYQNKPNIVVNNNPGDNNQINQQLPLKIHDEALQAIQAHLDAAAQAETQKVLEQAQKEALAHVEAQHQAIAKAKSDAQKAVLAQIAVQNQAYGHSQTYEQPQALPLKANIIHIPVNVARHNYNQQDNIEVTHHVPVNPIALSLKAEIQSTTAEPISNYQQNNGEKTFPVFQNIQPVQVHQNNEIYHNHVQSAPVLVYSQQQKIDKHRQPTLEKVSVTKTHSVTQGQHTPSAYQEVVLETEHQRETIYPTAQNKDELESKDKQYASRYAFGYRIKDFEQGNDFGHQEKRDGKSAKGQYHVLLPDGRLQKVEYYADPTGYHAKVSYENIAHH